VLRHRSPLPMGRLEPREGREVMADFCAQCWPEAWGDPAEIGKPAGFNDFIDEGCPEGSVMSALCEGCGPTLVDRDGVCRYACAENHAPRPVKGERSRWLRN
jgi:hypothetical protein